MRRIFFTLTIMALAAPIVGAQEFDDIYYNPKKDKSVNSQTVKKKKQSYYIQDFENVDVDEYNRRGHYYTSPVDTIGMRAENDEDFVYTQQIQKFYNPTIVIDNSDILQDVLLNSYGNVEIVFDNGIPSFAPIYSWPYYAGVYYGWNNPWYWGPSWSWGWGPSWTWGPSWNWGWGPSWAWGPSWNWGWGPSWSWGPSWNLGWGGRPHYADYRPNGRYPNRPGAGWASNTRPGGNAGRPGSMGRPGGNRRPAYGNSQNNNSGGIFGGNRNNHHRTYQVNGENGSNRTNSYNGTTRPGGNRNGYTVNQNGHRTYNNNGNTNNTNRYNRSTDRSNNYNSNTNRNTNRNSYNSGGFNNHRSSGGGFGGGSRGGGGGRGRHR